MKKTANQKTTSPANFLKISDRKRLATMATRSKIINEWKLVYEHQQKWPDDDFKKFHFYFPKKTKTIRRLHDAALADWEERGADFEYYPHINLKWRIRGAGCINWRYTVTTLGRIKLLPPPNKPYWPSLCGAFGET